MATSARYCIVDKDKGVGTVKFYVGGNLVSGADFKLYSEYDVLIENWKMSADNDSFSMKIPETPLLKLHKAKLIWNVLCCSSNPRVFSGKIEISVIQEGKPCQMTTPAEWNLKNIPPCSVNVPDKFTSALTFIVRA